MIDVHCHLNFRAFEKDYNEVIKRAEKAGVTTIINVGTKLDSSQKAVDLAQEYKNLYAIVGIHPHHADKIDPSKSQGSSNEGSGQGLKQDWFEQLEIVAKSSKKVVGIGEIGMDYYRYQSNGITDPKAQEEIFIKQIKLAKKLKLPIQIHNRHAGKDIIDILLNHKSYLLSPNPGMFHCMSGDLEFLKSVLDLGFFVGFDGNITYKGVAPGENTPLPKLVKYAPLDRIVIETDSPYLTPEPHRGKRNEPKYAIIVRDAIVKIKGVSVEKVEAITTQNTQALFNLKYE